MFKLANITEKFKPAKRQKLKERVLKNREAVLGIMSEKVKGAKQCPYLMGEKCLGSFCEHFMEFTNITKVTDEKTGEVKDKTLTFWRCAHVQLPILIIELNRNIREILITLNRRREF